MYYYKVMSFGLKNAGVTFQRIMMWVFEKQIRHQVEIYVDDLLVKSKVASQNMQHLAPVFAILQQYDIKLNPTKCIFVVISIKFFDHFFTWKGIEANPN